MPNLEQRNEPEPLPSDTGVSDLFHHLPLDEQLRQLPDMLDTVLASEKREQVIFYLEALLATAAPERSPFYVSRERLANTQAFTEGELAQLSDEDFTVMGHRLQEHYREDWYPEEIVFHAQAMLEEKAKTTTE